MVTSTSAQREAAVRRVLLLTLGLNVLVAAIKGAYGAWTGSLAVASDAIHSSLDAASNVLGLMATAAAARPPDDEHPYGHRKIETAAAAALGVLIALAAARFGWNAVVALIAGNPAPAVPAVGFLVVGGTLAINIGVAWWEDRQGRALDSAFLVADAAHTSSDVLVTVGVLVSLVLAGMGYAWADPVAALVVMVVIARVAWRVLWGNLSVLIDRAVFSEEAVTRVATEVDGALGCHSVRSRGPAGAVHLDLHLELDGSTSLDEAHRVAHSVEDRLRRALPGLVDVTIHTEPAGTCRRPGKITP